MELFRYIARTAAREIEFVEYEPNKGDKERITGGVFAGATGYIRRVHGTKRFVVCIEGIAAIATTYIPRQYIEKIE
jgi:transcription antitermination factor NusG